MDEKAPPVDAYIAALVAAAGRAVASAPAPREAARPAARKNVAGRAGYRQAITRAMVEIRVAR